MNASNTPGQDGLTVLDYRQNVTSGRFNKCYVHFRTKSGNRSEERRVGKEC